MITYRGARTQKTSDNTNAMHASFDGCVALATRSSASEGNGRPKIG